MNQGITYVQAEFQTEPRVLKEIGKVLWELTWARGRVWLPEDKRE